MKSALGTLFQEKEIEDKYYITDMNIGNVPCKGLGLACEQVTNSVAISFTHEKWTAPIGYRALYLMTKPNRNLFYQKRAIYATSNNARHTKIL